MSCTSHLPIIQSYLKTLKGLPKKPPSYYKHSSPSSSFLYTGSCAPPPSPILSTATPIHGPTIGTFLANPAIVPRKSPNRMKMPYSSTRNPTRAQRIKIRVRPAKKAAVPLSFWRRAKKSAVFWGPIIIVRPRRKRIYSFCVSLGCDCARRGGRMYIAHCKPVRDWLALYRRSLI